MSMNFHRTTDEVLTAKIRQYRKELQHHKKKDSPETIIAYYKGKIDGIQQLIRLIRAEQLSFTLYLEREDVPKEVKIEALTRPKR